MKNWATNLIAMMILMLGILSTAQAQRVPVQLEVSTVNEDQDFGYTVDLDGDVAIVGAFRDEDGIVLETGAVFVYRFDGTTWTEEAKLEADNAGPLHWFGWDVALSGDVLLASARNGDTFTTNGGDVTVFRHNGNVWMEEDVLTPGDGVVGDYGFAVDIDGDLAAVGASGRPGTVGGEGGVYLYRHNGGQWLEEDLLLGSDLSLQSFFGNDVAIDGDRILVGAFNADDSTSNQAGKLFVFDYDGSQWNESAVLQSNDSNNIANLGVSVDIEGDWAVGGAPLDDELRGGSGAALMYRYDGSNWNFHSKLTASDGEGFYLFGSSVDLSGNQLLVTADNWAPAGGNTSGKAYLFQYDDATDTWVEMESFVPAGVSTGGAFGHAAAMQGDVMIIGAPEHSGMLDDMGTAYIYGEPSVATSVESMESPGTIAVSGPYPNPFVGSAFLNVKTDEPQHIHVALFDVLGREIKTVFAGMLSSQVTNLEVEAGNLPAGLYWIRIQKPDGMVSYPIVLAR